MYKNIVFIDFDGTITTEDTLTGAILPFVDPKEFKEYNGKLFSGENDPEVRWFATLMTTVLQNGCRKCWNI